MPHPVCLLKSLNLDVAQAIRETQRLQMLHAKPLPIDRDQSLSVWELAALLKEQSKGNSHGTLSVSPEPLFFLLWLTLHIWLLLLIWLFIRIGFMRCGFRFWRKLLKPWNIRQGILGYFLDLWYCAGVQRPNKFPCFPYHCFPQVRENQLTSPSPHTLSRG